MELSVVSIQGKDTGKKVKLSEEIYSIEPNDHAIYLDVKQHLANCRQGTHKSKQRNEVSGTTKKLKKQKGTGGARAGSMKSPIFIGGGRVFGPEPRDYHFKLNKKLKTLARRSALAYKAKESKISILEDFSLAKPNTKDFLSIIKSLNLTSRKTLIVVSEENENIYLSSRNLKNTKVIPVNELNTYDVLNSDTLLLSLGSVSQIEALLN